MGNQMNQLLDQHDDDALNQELLEAASKGDRFIHYIVDTIGFYALMLVVGAGIGFLGLLSGNTAVTGYILEEESSVASTLLEYLFTIVIILVYYTGLEYFLNGKSLGKFLTRCRAVREDGGRMTLSMVFIRSLCRLIPFEQFSFLGQTSVGLHDRLSKTTVVKERRS
jgi:uncharacterized RDD family membrane protein YckC